MPFMPLAGMKRKKNIETPSKASLQDSLWLLVLTNVGEIQQVQVQVSSEVANEILH